MVKSAMVKSMMPDLVMGWRFRGKLDGENMGWSAAGWRTGEEFTEVILMRGLTTDRTFRDIAKDRTQGHQVELAGYDRAGEKPLVTFKLTDAKVVGYELRGVLVANKSYQELFLDPAGTDDEDWIRAAGFDACSSHVVVEAIRLRGVDVEL